MKTNLITANRFPEFFREEFPDLITFVEEYYRYIEEDTFNGKLNYATDLDLVSSLDEKYFNIFIEHYKNQFALDVPVLDQISTVEFLRRAAEVYSHRGTEKCLKFLFRAAFGEEIEVFYPKYNMLRASESTWVQEYHIRLQQIYKITPSTRIESRDKLSWSNDKGNFSVLVKNVEYISDSDALVFFDAKPTFYIDVASTSNLQKFSIKRNDVKVYEGIIKKTFSHFEIHSPGKFWQKGQVFEIPGSKKNSICRVLNTTSDGAIKSIEIKQYGYDLLDNSWYTIYPGPKPSAQNINVTSEVDSFNSTTGVITRHHIITILDGSDGFTEIIDGGQWIQTYMLSGDYYKHQPPETAPYFGSVAFIQTYETSASTLFTDKQTLSFDDWKSSETILISRFDYVVKGRGKFTDWSGQISNALSVIQDSFYYQTYSYVIETVKSLKEAESIIKFNHPTGTKSFIQQKRLNELSYGVTGYRSISRDYVVLFDETTIYDFVAKDVLKPVSDEMFTDDQIYKNLSKDGLTDSVIYNYVPESVQITSFFGDVETFFDGGFFTKQLEIVE